MHKVGVLLFLAFVVGLAMSQASQCPQPVEQTCIKLGGNCTDTNSVCDDGSFCNFINSTLSVCAPLINVGQNCTSNYQCVGGDIQNTRCWNGTCQSVTMNGTAGQPCSLLQECNNSLYCNKTAGDFDATGFCLTPVAKGQNCSAESVCGLGLLCNLGTCIDAFSVAEGGACGQTGNIVASPCSAGLYCLWNVTNNNGTCVKAFASSNAPCNSTVACANPQEYCVCNSGKQTCVAPPTVTQSEATDYSSLMTCLVSDNCNLLDPTCCSAHKCTVYELFYGGAGALLSMCGSTNPYASCDKSAAENAWDKLSKNEKIGVIAGAVAVVLIIVIVITCCCCKRKKNKYSEI